MSIRAAQIYISGERKRSLWVISRAEGTDVTPDEVGDRLLGEIIAVKYPTLAKFEAEIAGIEAKMMEAAKPKH